MSKHRPKSAPLLTYILQARARAELSELSCY